MRKVSLKKLILSRETLRNLSAEQLMGIAGGITKLSDCTERSLTNCDSCRTTTDEPTTTCV